jgi:hypothetical protein
MGELMGSENGRTGARPSERNPDWREQPPQAESPITSLLKPNTYWPDLLPYNSTSELR